MPTISLSGTTETVLIESAEARYLGTYDDRAIVVSVAIDDIVMAYPQLDGEPVDVTVRLSSQIESVANEVVAGGREPHIVGEGLHLALARSDLRQWDGQPRF